MKITDHQVKAFQRIKLCLSEFVERETKFRRIPQREQIGYPEFVKLILDMSTPYSNSGTNSVLVGENCNDPNPSPLSQTRTSPSPIEITQGNSIKPLYTLVFSLFATRKKD